jgi:hypothetical protein
MSLSGCDVDLERKGGHCACVVAGGRIAVRSIAQAMRWLAGVVGSEKRGGARAALPKFDENQFCRVGRGQC